MWYCGNHRPAGWLAFVLAAVLLLPAPGLLSAASGPYDTAVPFGTLSSVGANDATIDVVGYFE